MRKFVERTRREKLLQKSALKIQTSWRARRDKHLAYVRVLGLKENPRLYFLKEQRIDLQKIFRLMLQKFPFLKENYGMDKLKSLITSTNAYEMIRYPNPLIFKKQKIPIIQYVRPTVYSKVRITAKMSKLI